MRILFIFFSLILLSCSGYEPLTRNRTPYTDNEIRLDGYYYSIGKEFINGFEPDYVDVFTLNQNGIYFNVTKGSIDSNLKREIILRDLDQSVQYRVDNIDRFKESRLYWGIFYCDDSEIIIQNWEQAANAGAYPIRTLEGTVVNDTTLHFHKLIGAYPNNKGGKKKIKAIDETYHFRKFSPKPDSINIFIE